MSWKAQKVVIGNKNNLLVTGRNQTLVSFQTLPKKKCKGIGAIELQKL